MRIGYGYDSHRFTTGDHLWIGGICVPFHQGVVAHSDGDVLLHALIDALLGAAALGDIGQHFPDSDPQYHQVKSSYLLEKVWVLLKHHGYHVINIDSTVITEKPKIAPFILPMRESIAHLLDLELNAISIKAKTSEKMGFIGREEGLAAHVVVLLGTEC